MSLLVLRCRDLEASREFYERLGLMFLPERHGQGPKHYAATINGLVMELYPQKSDINLGQEIPDSTRIGFSIGSLDNVLQTMQEKGDKIHSMPHQKQWGYQAIVFDPDGRTVELTEQREMI